MTIQENLKKGTSEMMILFLLQKEDMYGYQLTQELVKHSKGYYQLPEGSLYPTLYRLIKKEAVTVHERIVGKRLRKYYHLEEKGRRDLAHFKEEYTKLNLGIHNILVNREKEE